MLELAGYFLRKLLNIQYAKVHYGTITCFNELVLLVTKPTKFCSCCTALLLQSRLPILKSNYEINTLSRLIRSSR